MTQSKQDFSIPKDFVFQVEPPPSLAGLLDASDAIGDEYLSPDEIQTRDADLAAAIAEVNAILNSFAS